MQRDDDDDNEDEDGENHEDDSDDDDDDDNEDGEWDADNDNDSDDDSDNDDERMYVHAQVLENYWITKYMVQLLSTIVCCIYPIVLISFRNLQFLQLS